MTHSGDGPKSNTGAGMATLRSSHLIQRRPGAGHAPRPPNQRQIEQHRAEGERATENWAKNRPMGTGGAESEGCMIAAIARNEPVWTFERADYDG